MRITFKLRYHTNYGQSLLLTGDHEIFGNGNIEKAIPLQYLDEEFWQIVIFIPKGAVPDARIIYHYVLRNSDGLLVDDWGNDRVVNLGAFGQDEIVLIDSWNYAGAFENAFYTEPFQKVLLKTDGVTPTFLSAAVQPSEAKQFWRGRIYRSQTPRRLVQASGPEADTNPSD